MKSKIFKLFSLCLSLTMFMTFMPKNVLAVNVGEEIVVDEISYRVTSDHTVALQYPNFIANTDVMIPETIQEADGTTYSVTSIEEFAFAGSDITSIEIPASVQTIGDWAFAECINLTSVSFYGNSSRALEIGDSAFYKCFALQSAHLPEDTQVIGPSAFWECESLESFAFPKGIKEIGDSAFDSCISLQTIELPEGIEKIGSYAFRRCTALRSIHLPEGLQEIGLGVFQLENNQVIEYINIPSTVKLLGEYFLTGVKADGTTVLVFQGNEPPIMEENALSGISGMNNKPTVYFPADATEAYTKAGTPLVESGLIQPNSSQEEHEQSYGLEFDESFQICPGKTEKLPVTYTKPKDATLSFTVDDSNIATVDALGNITTHKAGDVKIAGTILLHGQELVSDSCQITVGHHYVWVIDKEPTQDSNGLKHQQCTDCSDTKETVIIPALPSEGSSGGSGNISKEEVDPVYRAYNPNSGEHLYTLDEKELKHLTSVGWYDEGIAFMAQKEKEGEKLFRIYNPNSGLHHYTLGKNEKNTLVSLGWDDEGIAWYTSKKPMHHAVYRLYNINDGQHHYTMDQHEKDVLDAIGWNFEGIAFRSAPISNKYSLGK